MEDELYAIHADRGEAHWWFEGRRQCLDVVIEQAFGPDGPGVGRSLLDVGCGAGANLEMLARFGAVTGLDPEPSVLEACRKLHGDRFDLIAGHIPDDVPGDGSFDLVGAFDVLEHIEDDHGAAAKIFQALKPGGLFVAAVPAYPMLWGITDELSHHMRRYRTARLVEVLEAAGFVVERTTHFNTWMFPPAAAVRLGRRLLPRNRKPPKADLAMTPARWDGLLTKVFASERHLLRRTDLPVGVSLVAVARRPR